MLARRTFPLGQVVELPVSVELEELALQVADHGDDLVGVRRAELAMQLLPIAVEAQELHLQIPSHGTVATPAAPV